MTNLELNFQNLDLKKKLLNFQPNHPRLDPIDLPSTHPRNLLVPVYKVILYNLNYNKILCY